MGWKHRKFAGILSSQYGLTTGLRMTLDVIADHCMEKKGDAVNLSNANLANKVGVTPMTVIRYLKKLDVVTELVQSKVQGQTSHYILHLPEGFEPEEFNQYQADVINPQSKAQKLSTFAELAKKTLEQFEDPGDEAMYTGSVPEVDDWRECRRIHLDLLNDPQYGDTVAERIKHAIILGEHPAWGGTGTAISKELPYDPSVRVDGLGTPQNRFEHDQGHPFEPGYNPNNPGSNTK